MGVELMFETPDMMTLQLFKLWQQEHLDCKITVHCMGEEDEGYELGYWRSEKTIPLVAPVPPVHILDINPKTGSDTYHPIRAGVKYCDDFSLWLCGRS